MSELIDNRAQRVAVLKGIIERLHAGEAPDTVRESLRTLVKQTNHTEIIAMEQQLMAEGMPVEKLHGMCDLHSQVTRDVLVQLPPRPLAPGHPVDTFRRENTALREALARVRDAMTGVLMAGTPEETEKAGLAWRVGLAELADVDKHYQRKEHLLFSVLERHGINGPSKVMWAKDDQVRAALKQLTSAAREASSTGAWQGLASGYGPVVAEAVEEMIYKEEQILFPLCLDRFTEDEWAEIWTASPRYGWCLVEPRTGYQPPASAGAPLNVPGEITLPTGTLSLEQMEAIFSVLPVDLTFVDADDRVAFFSEGPHRVFARSRAIIGRKVQNCHPPASVGIVEQILSDFREGRQNVAEFWIPFTGRFVHIRYFAVRSEHGRYLGTLEVTQDVSGIRSLEGQRRLLQYDTPAAVH